MFSVLSITNHRWWGRRRFPSLVDYFRLVLLISEAAGDATHRCLVSLFLVDSPHYGLRIHDLGNVYYRVKRMFRCNYRRSPQCLVSVSLTALGQAAPGEQEIPGSAEIHCPWCRMRRSGSSDAKPLAGGVRIMKKRNVVASSQFWCEKKKKRHQRRHPSRDLAVVSGIIWLQWGRPPPTKRLRHW